MVGKKRKIHFENIESQPRVRHFFKFVTSHAKTFLTVCRFETVAVRKPFISRSNGMGCRSNGLSYPFKNN